MTDNPYLAAHTLPNYDSGFDWTSVDELDETELREQMDLLREAVEHHSRLYYEEMQPVVADSVYDEIFHRLDDIEEHLDIDDPDSPTNAVGTGRY